MFKRGSVGKGSAACRRPAFRRNTPPGSSRAVGGRLPAEERAAGPQALAVAVEVTAGYALGHLHLDTAQLGRVRRRLLEGDEACALAAARPAQVGQAGEDARIRRCVSAHGPRVMGVEPDTMLQYMPALTAASQVPQSPHVPPGTFIERFRISASARGRSRSTPAFL